MIRATDKAPVRKSASTTVTVSIVRNMYAPVFEQPGGYTGQDLNGAGLGETLLTLVAADNDTNVPLNRDVSSFVFYLLSQTSSLILVVNKVISFFNLLCSIVSVQMFCLMASLFVYLFIFFF